MISESTFMVMYRPYLAGEEGDYLHQTLDEALAAARAHGGDLHNVWTILDSGDGDDDNLYASPGAHIVNRLGYVVTERPWETGLEDAVWFEDDFDADADCAA